MSDARSAAVHFSEVLAREPGNAAARASLASALFTYGHELRAAGSAEPAAAAFAQAARFASDNADAWVAFGNACMEAEMQRVDATRSHATTGGEAWLAHAIDAFSHAVGLQPQDAEIAAKLAMAARYGCAWPDAERAIASSSQHRSRCASRWPRWRCFPMP
jgi:tetratricopeptide (TPR) repeat protein